MSKIKTFLLITLFLSIISLSAVSAQDNDTILETNSIDNEVINHIETVEINEGELSASNENDVKLSGIQDDDKLKTSYYYDSEEDEVYHDDTLITKNIVKYYNDGKKFTVKLVDENGTPQEGVGVGFGKENAKEPKIAFTNSKGIATFSINFAVGKHKVITIIELENENDMNWAENTITVKSTIPTQTLTKSIKQKNKKFSIKFLDKKGKVLKNKKVKVKVKSKTYTIKTNSKGIAKIKINVFKKGKHSITAINTVTKEKRKITVKITK